PSAMSGGVQPQGSLAKSIEPASWVPRVSVGLAPTPSVLSRIAPGPPAAAFAAGNAAGSRARNGKAPRSTRVGGGRSATSTVATSVAVDGSPLATAGFADRK